MWCGLVHSQVRLGDTWCHHVQILRSSVPQGFTFRIIIISVSGRAFRNFKLFVPCIFLTYGIKTNWCHYFNFIYILPDFYMFRAHRPILRRVHTAVHTTIGSVSVLLWPCALYVLAGLGDYSTTTTFRTWDIPSELLTKSLVRFLI